MSNERTPPATVPWEKLVKPFMAARKGFVISGVLMILGGGLSIASGIERDIGTVPMQTDAALAGAISGYSNPVQSARLAERSDQAFESMVSGVLFVFLGFGMLGTVAVGTLFIRHREKLAITVNKESKQAA